MIFFKIFRLLKKSNTYNDESSSQRRRDGNGSFRNLASSPRNGIPAASIGNRGVRGFFFPENANVRGLLATENTNVSRMFLSKQKVRHDHSMILPSSPKGDTTPCVENTSIGQFIVNCDLANEKIENDFDTLQHEYAWSTYELPRTKELSIFLRHDRSKRRGIVYSTSVDQQTSTCVIPPNKYDRFFPEVKDSSNI